jgi:hypothetical protein
MTYNQKLKNVLIQKTGMIATNVQDVEFRQDSAGSPETLKITFSPAQAENTMNYLLYNFGNNKDFVIQRDAQNPYACTVQPSETNPFMQKPSILTDFLGMTQQEAQTLKNEMSASSYQTSLSAYSGFAQNNLWINSQSFQGQPLYSQPLNLINNFSQSQALPYSYNNSIPPSATFPGGIINNPYNNPPLFPVHAVPVLQPQNDFLYPGPTVDLPVAIRAGNTYHDFKNVAELLKMARGTLSEEEAMKCCFTQHPEVLGFLVHKAEEAEKRGNPLPDNTWGRLAHEFHSELQVGGSIAVRIGKNNRDLQGKSWEERDLRPYINNNLEGKNAASVDKSKAVDIKQKNKSRILENNDQEQIKKPRTIKDAILKNVLRVPYTDESWQITIEGKPGDHRGSHDTLKIKGMGTGSAWVLEKCLSDKGLIFARDDMPSGAEFTVSGADNMNMRDRKQTVLGVMKHVFGLDDARAKEILREEKAKGIVSQPSYEQYQVQTVPQAFQQQQSQPLVSRPFAWTSMKQFLSGKDQALITNNIVNICKYGSYGNINGNMEVKISKKPNRTLSNVSDRHQVHLFFDNAADAGVFRSYLDQRGILAAQDNTTFTIGAFQTSTGYRTVEDVLRSEWGVSNSKAILHKADKGFSLPF